MNKSEWLASRGEPLSDPHKLDALQPVPTVTFTEKELDDAAEASARECVCGLSDKMHDFLTDSQIDGLKQDIRAAVKTSLIFMLMNHIEPGGCLTEGHEWATDHENDPMVCLHCGAEYSDR